MIELVPSRITFLSCILTSIACEIVRARGAYKRLPAYSEPDFLHILVFGWELESILVYATIFLPFIVVVSNKHNQNITKFWFWFSLIALALTCALIPAAMNGRWLATNDIISFFYWSVVLAPAVVYSNRDQS